MKIQNPQKGQMSMPVIIGIIALVAIIGGFAYFMTQQNANNTETDTTNEETMQTTTPPSENNAAGQTSEETMGETAGENEVTIEITGQPFEFTPNTITVNEGDTVTVKFTNAQGMHDFVIDEFDVATDVIDAGESQEVTFVADKKGTFEFYCSVGNHRQMGMVGTLTVN